MNNVDKIKISLYQGVKDNTGTVVDLMSFLNDRSHEGEIKHLRSVEDPEERKRIKQNLPCATISGVFNPTRKRDNLQQHSGLIVLDFDAKDNPNVTDWEALKTQCSKVPQIAYCSLSVSGKGVFMIIPLAHPSMHEKQFEALVNDFKSVGLVVDPSGSDVSRLRFVSFDEKPYYNPNAIPYRKIEIEPQQVRETAIMTSHYMQQPFVYDANDTLAKAEYLCQELEARKIDITQGYYNWLTVGFALSELGESGRSLYHMVSSVNSKYKPEETDRKYSECLRTRNGEITIATFFAKCSEYGIRYSLGNPIERKSAFDDFKDIDNV